MHGGLLAVRAWAEKYGVAPGPETVTRAFLGTLLETCRMAGGATIPASAVEVRFAQPDAPYAGGGFDSLHPEAPGDKSAGGAVQPIWITIRVPRDQPTCHTVGS